MTPAGEWERTKVRVKSPLTLTLSRQGRENYKVRLPRFARNDKRKEGTAGDRGSFYEAQHMPGYFLAFLFLSLSGMPCRMIVETAHGKRI
jgi:hypothetical protein